MKSKITLLIALILIAIFPEINAQMTPTQAVKAMGRGINLGNTLDAPESEGSWAPKAEEYYFDAYKDAGFQSVRIPITWDNRVSKTAPYKVDTTFMNRVEEVVDWGLERGLMIIINAHHDDWLKDNYSTANIARFEAIWTQISERFHTKSDSLLFEPLNEPHGMTIEQAADANKRALAIIREKNPTRNVVISGNGWSAIKDLLTMPVPSGDSHLIGYFHTYDPWDFSSAEKSRTWGTKSDKDYISSEFQKAKNWSTNNRVPVIISEFGAVHETDFNSRMRHYAHFVEESLSRGISFMAWDDGGWYEIYRRGEKKWHETKDILIYNTTKTATNLELSIQNDSLVNVEWENRNDATSMLRIERKNGEEFVIIDSVEASVTSYLDETTERGAQYQYRISQIVDEKLIISYPQKITIFSDRKPFNGTAIAIPGTLEAEDFDIGGNDFTYSDTEELNQGGAYRNESVDIEERTDGGYQVGYVEVNEWLEYTVNVDSTKTYTFTTSIAAMEKGGKFTLSTSTSNQSTSVDIPSTNSWTTLTEVRGEIELEAGEQILRITIDKKPAFNLDKLVFSISDGSTDPIDPIEPPLSLEDELAKNGLAVYPNPFTSNLKIKFVKNSLSETSLQIYNAIGNQVKIIEVKGTEVEVNFDGLSKGMYFIKYTDGNQDFIRKVIKQ